MNIRQMPLEELELLSYADIAYEILKADKVRLTTPVLFSEVCKLLQIDEDFDMIGDFYTTLTTDKRFLLVEDAKWDLKEYNIVKTIIDDDEEDVEEDTEEEVTDEAEDDAVMSPDIDDYEDDTDDLDDLSIITEEDMEEE